MFESLSYDSSVHNIDGVRNIISGTFMENSSHNLDGYDYASLLMYAGEVSKVSPYHLATRIIQEQGADGRGNQISGNVSGYEAIIIITARTHMQAAVCQQSRMV